MINEWVKEALKERGIKVLKEGFEIEFFKGKIQKVKDLPTALRQQQHIIDQQREEQEENKSIGLLMREFHDIVVSLETMTIEQLTEKKYKNIMDKLWSILEIMSKKKETLRKEGYSKLLKVYAMLEKKNIPAANMVSFAALDRMRKRWLVNEKVIDRSNARLEALKTLSL